MSGQDAGAALAAALLAVDPEGLGGAVLRGPGGPAREAWLECLRELLRERSVFRLPPHAEASRLTGGIDVAATLRTGRPCRDPGLLAAAAGGILVLASAERLEPGKAALIAAALDGEARPFLLIALDEGIAPEEGLPPILAGRAAFPIALEDTAPPDVSGFAIAEARAALAAVRLPDAISGALCATAQALGIASLRPALMACRAARAAAALAGRSVAEADDAAVAARLVLAPRATRLPEAEGGGEAEAAPPPESGAQTDETPDERDGPTSRELSELLLQSVKAALPEGLLSELESMAAAARGAKAGAGAVSKQTGLRRGRPAGTRAGQPGHGARLSLIETLRAAAPWQPVRRRDAPPGRAGLLVERGDFRIARYKQKRETTAIFVVDGSGSAALHRMGEAKGAVELLLADCYVRRDRTALIAFRGKSADVLLPPTRSLQRAKKCLADLPGGGGTPLAAGIEEALRVADQVRRQGGTPLAVFLTDGKANIARDGTPDRAAALRDAEQAARALKAASIRALMIDLSDQRSGPARKLAGDMGARYLPLPYADSAAISRAVSASMKAGG